MKTAIPPFLSQGGEDRICWRLFKKIGVRSKCAVEFGAVDGLYKSNTAYFRSVRGWRVILFDVEPQSAAVYQACITADNINELFRAHAVPEDLDLLSIDIDGNDLWVWKALTYRPRIVIIEYNPIWKPTQSFVVPYDPDRPKWDGTEYYGASAGALCRVASEKGYTLAASTRFNLIFAEAGLLPEKNLKKVERYHKHEREDPHDRAWSTYA